MVKPNTCQKLLQELKNNLDYNPKTGDLTYKNTRYGTKKVGEVAGNTAADGYLKFEFSGQCIIAHRAAWALFYGDWPKCTLDHINRVKDDNRITNLREVTQAENNYNRPKYKTKNYYKGVSKQGKKFRAMVTKDGVQIYLGTFSCPTLAALTYDREARVLFGACGLNFPEQFRR